MADTVNQVTVCLRVKLGWNETMLHVAFYPIIVWSVEPPHLARTRPWEALEAVSRISIHYVVLSGCRAGMCKHASPDPAWTRKSGIA